MRFWVKLSVFFYKVYVYYYLFCILCYLLCSVVLWLLWRFCKGWGDNLYWYGMLMFVFSDFLCIFVSDMYWVIGMDVFLMLCWGEWWCWILIFWDCGWVVYCVMEVLVGIKVILKRGLWKKNWCIFVIVVLCLVCFELWLFLGVFWLSVFWRFWFLFFWIKLFDYGFWCKCFY